ncbi:MAG: hypothetical protein AAGB12_07375 [Pseudomonadota bacterium]
MTQNTRREARILTEGAATATILGPLVIHTVEGLWSKRNALVNFEGETVDVSGVTDADSAGLAFIAEIFRLRTAANKKTEFINLPQTLLNIAEACGILSSLPIVNSKTEEKTD